MKIKTKVSAKKKPVKTGSKNKGTTGGFPTKKLIKLK